MLGFCAAHGDALLRTNEVAHLTGSALVVDPATGRFVVLHHRKLDRWLQPGGHADGDGDLAAWRSARRPRRRRSRASRCCSPPSTSTSTRWRRPAMPSTATSTSGSWCSHPPGPARHRRPATTSPRAIRWVDAAGAGRARPRRAAWCGWWHEGSPWSISWVGQRDTLGSPGTHQRHGCSRPALRPTRVERRRTPRRRRAVVDERDAAVAGHQVGAVVGAGRCPRAWHSLAGPLAQVAVAAAPPAPRPRMRVDAVDRRQRPGAARRRPRPRRRTRRWRTSACRR